MIIKIFNYGKKHAIFVIVCLLSIIVIGICLLIKIIGYRINSPLAYTQTIPDDLQGISGYDFFISISKEGAIIPGIQEGAIPQGLCYVEEQGVLLATGYHKGGAPSMIFVIEKESEKLVKTVILNDNTGSPFCGHVGGIASNGRWVWISSENNIYVSYFIYGFVLFH